MEQNQIVEHILKTELKKLNIYMSNLNNLTNQSDENILDKFRDNILTDDELVRFLSRLHLYTSKLDSSIRMINIISN